MMRETVLLCTVTVLLADALLSPVSSYRVNSTRETCCQVGSEFASRVLTGENVDLVTVSRMCSQPAVRAHLRLSNVTNGLRPLRCLVGAMACCLRVARSTMCRSGASQAPDCESAGLPMELSVGMSQIRLECCLCCQRNEMPPQQEFESCSLLQTGCPRARPSNDSADTSTGLARISSNLKDTVENATSRGSRTEHSAGGHTPPMKREIAMTTFSTLQGLKSSSQGPTGQDQHSPITDSMTSIKTPNDDSAVTMMSVTKATESTTDLGVPVEDWTHNTQGPRPSPGLSSRANQTSFNKPIICGPGRVWDLTLQVCVQTIISCPTGFILHPNNTKCVAIVTPDTPCLDGTQFNQFQNRCEDINECLNLDRCNKKTEVCRNVHGSFFCDCQKGFRHNRNKVCEDIDECGNSDLCTGEQRCKNTFGSYKCVRAIPCGFGWKEDADSNECVDIDECETYPGICGVGMKCVNIRGSHKCEDDECPPKMKRNNRGICSRCKDGFQFNNHTMTCEDIDECSSRPDPDDGPCKHAEVCFNLPGTFECVPKRKCRYGTILTKNGTACEDINECKLMRFRCQSDQICLNTYSSYQCVASPCAPSQQFDYPLNKCVCRDGFHLTMDNNCVDIDECSDTGSDGLCGAQFLCVNRPGGYSCIHRDECPPGMYRASMYSSCQDVDECETGEGKCPANMHCVNVVGSYRCMCNRGFVMMENNTCADVNECLLFRPEESCPDLEARCVNMAGGYKCQCPHGFQWSNYPLKKCLDINECERSNPCGQKHECINTIGSYKCKCRQGYRLAISGDSCEDIDECLLEPRKCVNGFCVNLPGRYACKCPPGFSIDSKEICHDTNECSSIDRVCGQDDQGEASKMCINLLGYYKCVNSSCGPRYTRRETGNGFICLLNKNSYCRLLDRACLLERPYRKVYEFIEMSSTTHSRSLISRLSISHLPPGVLKSKLQLRYAHNTDTKENISVKNAFQLVTSVHDRDSIDLVLLQPIQAPAEVLLVLQVNKYYQHEYLGHSEAMVHLYFTRYPHIDH